MNKSLFLLPILIILTGCSIKKPKPLFQNHTNTTIVKKQDIESFNKIPYTTWDITFEENISLLVYNYNDSSLLSLNNKTTSLLLPEWYRILGQYDDFPEYLILKKELNLYSYTISDWTINQILIDTLDEKNNVTVYPSISEKDKFYIHVVDWYLVDGMLSYQSKETKEYFYDAETNIATARKSSPVKDVYDNLLYYLHDSSWEIYDSESDIFYSWEQWLWRFAPIKKYTYKNHSTELVFDIPRDSSIDWNKFPHLKYHNWVFVVTDSIWFGTQEVMVYTIPTSQNRIIKEYKVSNILPSNILWWKWIYKKENSTYILWLWEVLLILKENSENPILLEQYNGITFSSSHYTSVHDKKLILKEDWHIQLIDLESWVKNMIGIKWFNKNNHTVLISK